MATQRLRKNPSAFCITKYPGHCDDLSTVSHIAHVATALDIVRAGQLQPRLVSDESKLRHRRIEVVWLSPNHWHQGSFYGNVEFTFDWKMIDRKFRYWVEAMAYSPPACRILLSNTELARLDPYSPIKDAGPWRKSKRQNEWNSFYTLEFMLHDALSLCDVKSISFVDHHRRICRAHGGQCREKRQDKFTAAMRFVAALVGEDLSDVNRALTKQGTGVSHWLISAWRKMQRSAPQNPWVGPVTSKSSRAESLAKAVLTEIGRGRIFDAGRLYSLFKSRKSALLSVRNALADHFELKRSHFPLDDTAVEAG
jgi:hypothetical protein